jgi:DMSO/TMAO reductase YedYZ molybdopterin-dependent catalytic subunit
MSEKTSLPPGQHERPDFPRFGLPEYARRAPAADAELCLTISDETGRSTEIDRSALQSLQRVEQSSDFHCVTTWSHRDLTWGGIRFRDFYRQFLVRTLQPDQDERTVLFRGLDGFSTTMLLEDALAPDVLLADMLNGEPLSVAHGLPLRLVAPQHYGYKNVKHLCAIEVLHEPRAPKHRLVDHLRGRVAYEERGIAPGWLLRFLYRPFIGEAVRQFARGLERRDETGKRRQARS